MPSGIWKTISLCIQEASYVLQNISKRPISFSVEFRDTIPLYITLFGGFPSSRHTNHVWCSKHFLLTLPKMVLLLCSFRILHSALSTIVGWLSKFSYWCHGKGYYINAQHGEEKNKQTKKPCPASFFTSEGKLAVITWYEQLKGELHFYII